MEVTALESSTPLPASCVCSSILDVEQFIMLLALGKTALSRQVARKASLVALKFSLEASSTTFSKSRKASGKQLISFVVRM